MVDGTRTFHACQSITGPLMRFKKADWERMAKYTKRSDGSKFTGDELKQEFIRELAQGHEVIPIGECDNFNYKNGCLGHPKE